MAAVHAVAPEVALPVLLELILIKHVYVILFWLGWRFDELFGLGEFFLY